MTARVLLVDDDGDLCETLADGLRAREFAVEWRTSASEAVALLGEQDFDVVLTDVKMQGTSGLELCERLAKDRPDVPVVVLTAFGSYESAVAAIHAGAYDFISKPVKLDVLAIAIQRAVQHRALREEVKRLRAQSHAERPHEIIGDSPAMQKVFDMVARVAETDATVLITGESGTGKELVARALHERSRRKHGGFVAVNCAAMPETLLESELFGHTKGAFTDAREAHRGLFAQASGGTLLLDEIGDMPLGLQPKLLRVLQDRRVRPVGSTAELPVDVRFIASTNRDLETAVEERRFREDLFFRINVVRIDLPPLRARAGDVLPLAQHFLDVIAKRTGKPVRGISPAAAERLVAYPWPGNVRELQNCVERAIALSRFDQISLDDLPENVRDFKPSHVVVAADDPSELVPLEEVERRYVMRVLEAVGGNKTAAARILGIERKTLYRKLEGWGAEAPKG